jgi:glycosyltransferase involved in cell wall biosynthesis
MGHQVTVLTMPKDRLPITESRPMPAGVNMVEIGLPAIFYRLRALHKKRFQGAPVSNESSGRPSLTRKLALSLDSYRVRKGIFATVRMPDATALWIRPALRWGRNAGTWDLVVSSAGPYATHLVGAHLKRSGLARFWVADYRDLWTDNDASTGLFPFTLIEKGLERRAMKHADLLVTVSSPLAETLGRKYGDERVEVIENGFDALDLAALDARPVFPRDDKVRIVHTGSIYKGKRDPAPLFAAISQLAHDRHTSHLLDRLEVIFCGAMTGHLTESIKRHAVGPWVRLLGVVPRPDALRMQRDAHALLFLEWGQGDVDGMLSGKLFEYLSSGTSIWGVGVTEKTETGKLLREAEAGTLFGTDVEHLAQELRNLLSSGEKESISRAEPVVARFERRVLAERLLQSVTSRMAVQPLS